MSPHIVYLSLGTNLGDRRHNLCRAILGLPASVRLIAESPVYETPPWGVTDQPAFLNMVIQAETDLPPLELLAALKELERDMGRQPAERYGPRLIDLDILFYDDLVIETPALTIPHPHLQERAFVLVPLVDLAPGLVHPLIGSTIQELLPPLDAKGVIRMTDPLVVIRNEPALAWKLAVNILGEDPGSPLAIRVGELVRQSPLVTTLLSERGPDGSLGHHPYKKWNGGHWILSHLGDLGYPSGDHSLHPLLDASFDWLLGAGREQSLRVIAGRTRRCGSIEGNAAWYSLQLGLADDRTSELIDRLLNWQWPDGGWNCDKRPEADTSSFMETLIPLRALALYARVSGDLRAKAAAERAAEVFLTRKLFLRRRDGQLMDKHFVRLSYPPYWHYNILFGLKVMAEAGFLSDPRCTPALDLLASKRLPDGGFPAEETYSRTTRPTLSGYSLLDWSGVSRVKMNPFITADALYVLRLAGIK
jgi:2-amino-4-hydroxy-6-hydroxymethyldihydropteridine diphosphokinase